MQGEFKMSSCRLFVSDVNRGNEDFECKRVDSRFSCVTSGAERFSSDLP